MGGTSASLGLRSERVAEAVSLAEQRPDFQIAGTNDQCFLAEVKKISPSATEAASIAQFETTGSCGFSTIPGRKLRRLIGRVNAQLRTLAHVELPGALVVGNPNAHLAFHTDSYAVLTAMRGLDTVSVTVPRDASIAPVFGHVYAGPGKQMTKSANTSTSAIICPREVDAMGLTVDVYHNAFAARPLSEGALSHPSVRQWKLTADDSTWELMAAATPVTRAAPVA